MKPSSARKYGTRAAFGLQFRYRIPRQGDQSRRPAESIFRSGWMKLAVFQSRPRSPRCRMREARPAYSRLWTARTEAWIGQHPLAASEDCGQAYLGTLHAAALDVVAGRKGWRRSGQAMLADVHGVVWLRRPGDWPRAPGLALHICRGEAPVESPSQNSSDRRLQRRSSGALITARRPGDISRSRPNDGYSPD